MAGVDQMSHADSSRTSSLTVTAFAVYKGNNKKLRVSKLPRSFIIAFVHGSFELHFADGFGQFGNLIRGVVFVKDALGSSFFNGGSRIL